MSRFRFACCTRGCRSVWLTLERPTALPFWRDHSLCSRATDTDDVIVGMTGGTGAQKSVAERYSSVFTISTSFTTIFHLSPS